MTAEQPARETAPAVRSRAAMSAESLLPNLVIAGVAKAGTTSLFWYLGQHPQVCPSIVKELNYFAPRPDAAPIASTDAYAAHFEHCVGQRYRLEASPRYWWNPETVLVPLRSTLSRPRVIVSLRDPVGRFWSHYTYMQSRGRLPRGQTIEAYIAACERREVDEAETSGATSALSVGLYARYLPAWLRACGSDLRIVFAEALFGDAAATVADLFRWLELDPGVAISFEQRNTTANPRSAATAKAAWNAVPALRGMLGRHPGARQRLRRVYEAVNAKGARPESIPSHVRDQLTAYYQPSNQQTARLLTGAGYTDLPSWLGTTSEGQA